MYYLLELDYPDAEKVIRVCDKLNTHVPGARSYETNRDVKWICKTLARMEAQDEEFEARLRALERLSGGEGRGGEEGFDGECRGRRGGGRGGGGGFEGAGRGIGGQVIARCQTWYRWAPHHARPGITLLFPNISFHFQSGEISVLGFWLNRAVSFEQNPHEPPASDNHAGMWAGN